MEEKVTTTNIIFYVRRFDPEKDASPRQEQYTVPVEKGMTVLDGLHYIKQTQDASLGFRFSCRMGVCGSCGMMINGKPGLACNTQILDVTQSALTVAPLPNFNLIRDLAPDLVPMFGVHQNIQPYIQRSDTAEREDPSMEYFQTPHQLEEYLQFTYCIKCGCCMAACPTMATDREYLGPMPLTQIYRYNTDSRDDAGDVRKKFVSESHGVFNCHYAGECSAACPKGVDPARAIQLMKKDLVLGYFGLAKHGKCAHLHKKPDKASWKAKIEVPAHTVGK
ncbi:MAG: succinate dehydrogenase iron-sulfur subunit [Deltaproteobacteria bacterium]|nr:succinate dehydrogenase iron-sulfur subunit [Deltaproteobacteria bacterium]